MVVWSSYSKRKGNAAYAMRCDAGTLPYPHAHTHTDTDTHKATQSVSQWGRPACLFAFLLPVCLSVPPVPLPPCCRAACVCSYLVGVYTHDTHTHTHNTVVLKPTNESSRGGVCVCAPFKSRVCLDLDDGRADGWLSCLMSPCTHTRTQPGRQTVGRQKKKPRPAMPWPSPPLSLDGSIAFTRTSLIHHSQTLILLPLCLSPPAARPPASCVRLESCSTAIYRTTPPRLRNASARFRGDWSVVRIPPPPAAAAAAGAAPAGVASASG